MLTTALIQAQQWAWCQEYYPELFERIKVGVQFISNGDELSFSGSLRNNNISIKMTLAMDL